MASRYCRLASWYWRIAGVSALVRAAVAGVSFEGTAIRFGTGEAGTEGSIGAALRASQAIDRVDFLVRGHYKRNR